MTRDNIKKNVLMFWPPNYCHRLQFLENFCYCGLHFSSITPWCLCVLAEECYKMRIYRCKS